MTLSELLKTACRDRKISISELARRTGQSPQNLTMKLRRDSISFQEFQKYLDILNIRLDFSLIYPDDTSMATAAVDRRAEDQLAILQADLELETRKNEYQKQLSSDIRTELFTVLGSAERALRNKGNPTSTVMCLEQIKESGDLMNRLFDQSLFGQDMSTPESERNVKANGDVRGKRILLVDDNELNREITKEMLEENGLEVDTAGDGAVAFRKVSEARPGYFACVLMDVRMPNTDGLAATRMIRHLPNRERASVPVIAMTANAYEEDRLRSFEAGMDAHLTKPISARDMMSTISRFLVKA